jgi:hypothetical protein
MSNLAILALAVIQALNTHRADLSAGKLKEDKKLSAAAQEHCQEMLRTHRMAPMPAAIVTAGNKRYVKFQELINHPRGARPTAESQLAFYLKHDDLRVTVDDADMNRIGSGVACGQGECYASVFIVQYK